MLRGQQPSGLDLAEVNDTGPIGAGLVAGRRLPAHTYQWGLANIIRLVVVALVVVVNE